MFRIGWEEYLKGVVWRKEEEVTAEVIGEFYAGIVKVND